MKIRITKFQRHLEIVGYSIAGEKLWERSVRMKDERLRREAVILCAGVLKIYFPEINKLEIGEFVTISDRGFFNKFPKEKWG